VEFGALVNIIGLRISTGDLLRGDLNGIHGVPAAIIGRLPGIVEKIKAHEGESIKLRQDGDFSIQKLENALRDSVKSNPRPDFH
jgi:hypothetical protein